MSDDWTLLCKVANETEAELLTGYLEHEGIEARVVGGSVPQYPIPLGQLGLTHVEVRRSDLARAEELLAKLPQAESDGGPFELAPDATADDDG